MNRSAAVKKIRRKAIRAAIAFSGIQRETLYGKIPGRISKDPKPRVLPACVASIFKILYIALYLKGSSGLPEIDRRLIPDLTA